MSARKQQLLKAHRRAKRLTLIAALVLLLVLGLTLALSLIHI